MPNPPVIAVCGCVAQQEGETLLAQSDQVGFVLGPGQIGRLDEALQAVEQGRRPVLTGFDPERGFRFSTYATYWIRQAIRKCLIDRSRLIRVPQAIQEELRNPECPMDPAEVRRVRQIMRGGVSMSAEGETQPPSQNAW